MTLENLLRVGKLKAHAADEREIAPFLQYYCISAKLPP
jgi:hypothetical protein